MTVEHNPAAEELARHLQVDHGCGRLVAAVATWAAGRSALAGSTVTGAEIVIEHFHEIAELHREHHPPLGPDELTIEGWMHEDA